MGPKVLYAERDRTLNHGVHLMATRNMNPPATVSFESLFGIKPKFPQVERLGWFPILMKI